MRLMTRFFVPVLFAVGALTFVGGQAARAQTTTLPIGGFVAPVTSSAANFFGGTQVGATLFNNFDFITTNGRLSGTLYSAAFQGASGNTAGTDFYYQVALNANTTSSLSSLQFGDFIKESISVGQTTTDIDGATAQFSSGTAGASFAFRPQSTSQDPIQFGFSGVTAGTVTTQTLVVRSSASNFTNLGNASLSAGSDVSGNITTNIYVSAATPEPGTVSLLGMGLVSGGGLGFVARRRRIAKK